MDKIQAEAAADALLAQARAARKWRSRPQWRRPYTLAERHLSAAFVVVGTVVGSVAAYFGAPTSGWTIVGSLWGAVGGFCIAAAVILIRRRSASADQGAAAALPAKRRPGD